MSDFGETIKDEALEKYTLGIMEDVVQHYKGKLYPKNCARMIERDVAKKLVEWIPEKYTEVDIKAMIGTTYVSVITEFMADEQTMMVVIHEEPIKVEEDMSYFQRSLMKGLGAPIDVADMTIKTSKPTIDFTQISSLSEPEPFSRTNVPRYETGVWSGVDLATVDVREEIMNQFAAEMTAEIDNQIMNDIMSAAAPLDEKPFQWSVPTSGWTEEKTFSWDDVKITTDNIEPVWFGAQMEEISFTENELDELIDLIHDVQSEVMKFV